MSKRIDIKPLKRVTHTDIEKWNAKLNENVPKLPFFIGIVGPRHRGKSVLLHNMLDKKTEGLYRSIFKENNIILYSPTYAWDTTLHDLKLKHVFTNTDNIHYIVQQIKEQQEDHRSVNNIAPVLLVLEDITNIPDAFKILEDLGYTGRHYHIHVMYVCHKFSSIRRGVRTQTQQWLLFEPHEQSEWEWVLDVFANRNTRSIWLTALRRAWDIPYNFVMIDFEEKEFHRIYRSGFNDPLFSEQEKAFLTMQIQSFSQTFIQPQPVQEDEYKV